MYLLVLFVNSKEEKKKKFGALVQGMLRVHLSVLFRQLLVLQLHFRDRLEETRMVDDESRAYSAAFLLGRFCARARFAFRCWLFRFDYGGVA